LARDNSGDTMRFEVESRLDDLFGETEGTDADDKYVSDNLFDESEITGPDKSYAANGNISNTFAEPEEIEVLEIHEEGIEMNESHPLEDLKSTVLSIDWEITDEVMGRFVDQVEELKREFKDNKINQLFLQLLGSVGVYIKTNRGKADPDAFKVLGSAFKAFDDVVSSETLPDAEKKKRLAVELEKFKALKKKIADKKQAAKAPPIHEPVIPPKETVVQDNHIELVVEAQRDDVKKNEDVAEIVLNPVDENTNVNSQAIIQEVLVEMKKFIRGEFDDLREELRLRKKRR